MTPATVGRFGNKYPGIRLDRAVEVSDTSRSFDGKITIAALDMLGLSPIVYLGKSGGYDLDKRWLALGVSIARVGNVKPGDRASHFVDDCRRRGRALDANRRRIGIAVSAAPIGQIKSGDPPIRIKNSGRRRTVPTGHDVRKGLGAWLKEAEVAVQPNDLRVTRENHIGRGQHISIECAKRDGSHTITSEDIRAGARTDQRRIEEDRIGRGDRRLRQRTDRISGTREDWLNGTNFTAGRDNADPECAENRL